MADQQPSNHHDGSAITSREEQISPAIRKVSFLSNLSNRISKSTGFLSNDTSPEESGHRTQKSTFGILADKQTDEVPGTVLLLDQTRNEPLGYDQMEIHREDVDVRLRRSVEQPKKKTPDGRIVLDPQPEDTPNDPLNWPAWRRDVALLSLGCYCMVGGGMTPILAAGFNNVAQTYSVTYSDVALTTGLYMMGLGVGSVIFSPTAILWGKRPVYLASSVLFVASAVWCAAAPSYGQLVVARVFQGIAVSPVECLPSSTIAEIFFLHERAFRIGIYTLLLLGGKNLIPLVSAAVIQSLGWRWVFWIVAICVGLGGILLFLFVPETFWDRTPRPKWRRASHSRSRASFSSMMRATLHRSTSRRSGELALARSRSLHRIVEKDQMELENQITGTSGQKPVNKPEEAHVHHGTKPTRMPSFTNIDINTDQANVSHLHNLNSPFYSDLEKHDNYFAPQCAIAEDKSDEVERRRTSNSATNPILEEDNALTRVSSAATQVSTTSSDGSDPKSAQYTTDLRNAPAQPWLKTLKLYNGRISTAKWWRVACRPFVLFAYPSVLWSAMVYSLSVGWLIVLSESVTAIFKSRDTYNFSAIQTGLVYLSPFIGGVLGTAIAGRLSDVLVRFMANRNGGIYEPEFRLIMAIPITITTVIGLMGYGWSAQERDNYMVPTIFFGVISFGCCIGSTTAITFCLDSYRQFSGEALVTLNFSKNILHGLIWSLFFPQWLQDDGPKLVFVSIGGIQIVCMLSTIPMYIYGKRARMWTVRRKMMERL